MIVMRFNPNPNPIPRAMMAIARIIIRIGSILFVDFFMEWLLWLVILLCERTFVGCKRIQNGKQRRSSIDVFVRVFDDWLQSNDQELSQSVCVKHAMLPCMMGRWPLHKSALEVRIRRQVSRTLLLNGLEKAHHWNDPISMHDLILWHVKQGERTILHDQLSPIRPPKEPTSCFHSCSNDRKAVGPRVWPFQ